jgi:hypothetical protein
MKQRKGKSKGTGKTQKKSEEAKKLREPLSCHMIHIMLLLFLRTTFVRARTLSIITAPLG